MKKRILTLLLTASMVLASIIIPVSADNTIVVFGDWTFKLISSDHTLKAIQYAGDLEDVVVPDRVNGDKVVELEEKLFFNCTELKKITLNNDLRIIGTSAFEGCTGLTSITIPENVVIIKEAAFKDCVNVSELRYDPDARSVFSQPNRSNRVFENIGRNVEGGVTVTFGELVTYVPANMFYPYSTGAVDNVKKLVFKGVSVGTIGPRAFYDCDSLSNVTLPNSVTVIGEGAFEGCDGFTKIAIPQNIKKIERGAFKDCVNVTELTYESDAENVFSVVGKDNCVFENVGAKTKGLSVIFGNNVTELPAYMFYAYSDGAVNNVTKIKFEGTNVKKIGNYAFYQSAKMESPTLPDSLTTIGEGAFEGCASITSVDIPQNVISIGDRAFKDCTKLGEIKYRPAGERVFKNQTKSNRVFENTGKDTNGVSVTFASSVKEIPSYMFYAFSDDAVNKVAKISFEGNNVANIGDYAFYHCTDLKAPTFPDNLTQIGESAFEGCSGFTSITIPQNVKIIAQRAFKDCVNAAKLNYDPVSAKVFRNSGVDNRVFENIAKNVKDGATVTFGAGVTEIPANMFHAFSEGAVDNVTKIAFAGTNLTTIGDSAFFGCTGLASPALPDSLTTIGDSAFEGCTGFTSISIPKNIRSIGVGAFKDCVNVTELSYYTVAAGVFRIRAKENRVFENIGNNTEKGTTVTFGEGVTEVPSYMFYAYSEEAFDNVTKVVFAGTNVSTIGDSAFCGCSKLAAPKLPESLATIGSSAFEGCAGFESISIPRSVKSIGQRAFKDCVNAAKLTYAPEGISVFRSKSDDNRVFENVGKSVKAGTAVTFGEYVKEIPSYMFYAYSEGAVDNVTSISFDGTNVAEIGAFAFYNCAALRTPALPDSIKTIGASAFEGCVSITSIIIPKNVKSIDQRAYKDCVAVTELRYESEGKSVFRNKSIDNRVFENIGKNAVGGVKVIVGSTVTEIPQNMFRQYANSEISRIKSVEFTDCGALTVCDGAFMSCVNLSDVKYYGSKGDREDNLKIEPNNDPLLKAKWTYVFSDPGDVNDDLYINARDVIAMMKYIIGSLPKTQTFIVKNADMDKNTLINAKDVILLMKELIASA